MSFSQLLDDSLRRMHKAVGEVVQYTPPGGETKNYYAVPVGSEREEVFSNSRRHVSGVLLEMLAADVTPLKGGGIVFLGAQYTIKTVKYADTDHRLWLVECAPAEV